MGVLLAAGGTSLLASCLIVMVFKHMYLFLFVGFKIGNDASMKLKRYSFYSHTNMPNGP